MWKTISEDCADVVLLCGRDRANHFYFLLIFGIGCNNSHSVSAHSHYVYTYDIGGGGGPSMMTVKMHRNFISPTSVQNEAITSADNHFLHIKRPALIAHSIKHTKPSSSCKCFLLICWMWAHEAYAGKPKCHSYLLFPHLAFFFQHSGKNAAVKWKKKNDWKIRACRWTSNPAPSCS